MLSEAIRREINRTKSMPGEIFESWQRNFISNPIEVVPCRTSTRGKPEIGVYEREAADKFYAGMVHTPGSIIRPGEDPEKITRERVIREIGAPVARLTILGTYNATTPRGHEWCRAELVKVVEGCSLKAIWVPYDEMPKNIVEHQMPFIEDAQRWIRDKLLK